MEQGDTGAQYTMCKRNWAALREYRTVSSSSVWAGGLETDMGFDFLVQLQLCEMRFKGPQREQHPKNTIIKAL